MYCTYVLLKLLIILSPHLGVNTNAEKIIKKKENQTEIHVMQTRRNIQYSTQANYQFSFSSRYYNDNRNPASPKQG